MRILSFDTSLNDIHVALMDDDRPLQELIITDTEGNTRQEAVAELMPAIKTIMERAGCTKSELGCIVVGAGPGSFTGIRTAVVTARTIGQALQLPVASVSLIDCYASVCKLPGAVILSAGRGRFFAASYFPNQQLLFDVDIEPVSGNDAELDLAFSEVAPWYCDPAAFVALSSVSRTLQMLPKIENIATKQAQIAWNRLCLNVTESGADGNGSLADKLLARFPYQKVTPLYLRNPSITLKKSDGN